MIKVRGKTATFTGKELKWLIKGSKRLGMSTQIFFTAHMWAAMLHMAEKEANEKTQKSRD